MKIVIAPNAFKNSLDALETAKCIEKGLKEGMPGCNCHVFPVADGGDGTGALILRAMGGREISGRFRNPRGKNISSSFGLIENGHTAVIEMAAASGLRLLDANHLDPMLTSSVGTGEMISGALDLKAKKIIIAIGGSATVDGGCGILHALGIQFLDADKNKLHPFPDELILARSIDISELDPRIKNTEIELWCDVRNPLLGPSGAATVFGPQKGATEKQVGLLEKMLHQLNILTTGLTGIDVSQIVSGGAAGGAAAFLHAFLNARIVDGIDEFLRLTGFERAIENAGLVITGEGQIDLQTLEGKGPYGVAKAAANKDIPVIGIAGKVPVDHHPQLSEVFPVLLSIEHQPLSLEESIRLTGPNLTRISRQIGNLLSFNL